MTVQKMSYWVPIDVKEERLNNLSDLAIGQAMGGSLGAVLVASAQRNLAALDLMTGPDLIDDTAPDAPDSDPRDDDVSETGQSLGDADPTGPEDHPGVPE